MRELLSGDYFPFGSQYYRAPSPPPEDWDRDLGRMAALGFNTVKFWVQWRWNHPEPDTFYFDDIDRLMELSERHDLRVMLNTIVDVAPAWIYRMYPDASMLTLDGRRIGPQTQPHRQIGGLGLCFNHDEAVEHMMRFLEATVERYREHPALEIWNVGSEPELTSSMAEMRLWADDASKMGDMLCHCDRCVAAFRGWLAGRYESIDALNTSWNRNYRSFEEAEVPKTRNTFNDLIDWRMFFVDTLGNNVRKRFEVAERVDAGRHPVMCHHVFIQGFPVTSTANDPWNVAQYGDLHGFTQMDDPMMHDILRSCARGKPVISAEMLMLMGYTLDTPDPVDADDFKRHIFTGIAANLKGFIFWQYRPELLGREAPAWGLTHLDGSETPWLQAFAECGRVLQDQRAFLFDAEPAPAEVAIFYSPENQVFAWASTGNEKSATDSLLGVHRALYERSIRTDFVHPRDITAGHLDGYRVLIIPFPYLLSREIADALRSWVARGGVLIGEAYLAGWNWEEGRHATVLPGYGLHEIARARQENAEPADEHTYLHVQGVARHRGMLPLHRGMNEAGGFISVQPVDVSDGLGRIEMVLTRPVQGLPKGSKLYGAIVKEIYRPEGARTIAEYADGRPAITVADHGDGKVVAVGSYLGLSYHRFGDPANGRFLAALVNELSGITGPRARGAGRVRVDVLTSGEDVMVILQNQELAPSEVTVDLPDIRPDVLRELFTGDEITPSSNRDGSCFTVTLGAREVRVYRA